MKRYHFLWALLLPFFGLAQGFQAGHVVYEHRLNLHLRLGEENEDLKAMLPEFQTSQVQLLFNETSALFQPLEEIEDVEHTDEEGNQMRFRAARMTNILYQDFANERQVEQRDFFTKQYLLEDPIQQREWKVTGETRQVLDFPCIKATWQNPDDENEMVTAWFAPAIPVSAGPSGFGGLPGLILELEMDGGAMTYTAVKVDPTPPAAGVITEPTDGKPISREKFDQMMEERMREMNAQGGGGARIIIRRN